MIIKDFTFKRFQPWAGAVDTFNTIIQNGKEEEAENLISELYPEGLTETKLNDILWFDDEYIMKSLGLSDDEEEEEEDGMGYLTEILSD